MNNTTTIKFWGVRGSTPCANAENMHFGGNTTCLQIRFPHTNELLILDCGTGFRNLGNALIAEERPLNGNIFITHPHWDHLQGFPFFKPFYDSKNKFQIFIPPQGVIGCRDILQGHMSNTFFPVSIDMLDADIGCDTFFQEEREFSEYSIEYMWAHHTIPTAIFKITIDGITIIFAPDNEIPLEENENNRSFLEEFRQYIHKADILIHDSQFSKEQYHNRKGWGHSAWERVIEVAQEEKVHHLYLTHHDPDSTDQYLFELSGKISQLHQNDFKHIALVKEGQEISLPSSRFKNIASH